MIVKKKTVGNIDVEPRQGGESARDARGRGRLLAIAATGGAVQAGSQPIALDGQRASASQLDAATLRSSFVMLWIGAWLRAGLW